MASLGSISVDLLYGQPTRPRDVVRVIAMPGYDSHRTQIIGRQADQAMLRSVQYEDSLVDARVQLLFNQELIGETVDVVDAVGTTHQFTSILDCQPSGEIRPVLRAGVTKYRLVCVWTVRMKA